jgi:hypothetical protein
LVEARCPFAKPDWSVAQSVALAFDIMVKYVVLSRMEMTTPLFLVLLLGAVSTSFGAGTDMVDGVIKVELLSASSGNI